MSNEIKDPNQAYLTELSLREHLLRAGRPEPRADVKQGTYTDPNDPHWEPRPHATINRGSRYSRDPKICRHQFAGNRARCPYCAAPNPEHV